MKASVALVIALFAPVLASATVADSSASGFTVKYALTLKSAPAEAYKKLVQVGEWWDSAHTYSGDAHNLSLEEKSGGCWCEKLPKGGAVKHMEVLAFMPGSRIVLDGALGPLQSMAVTGRMTIQLAPADGGGTKLAIIYSVSGYTPSGMNMIAPGADSVLTEAFTRLTSYIETGKPGSDKTK